MSNAVAQKPKFSVAIHTDGYKKLINNTLQDPKRAQRFIASVTSAVAVNPALQGCDAGTVLASALLGESLNLSPSPMLGHYYMVPFEDRKNKRTVATFILGYKGYIQLAIRSGMYRRLNVLPIKEGELIRFDPLNEEIEVNLIGDALTRETAKTIGYYAMFEYENGFRKALYWTYEQMEQHALRYSKGYAAKKGYTFWEKDFDVMACKTMLRQLISKWGIMSIEMQSAFEADGYSVRDGAPDYLTGSDVEDITLDNPMLTDGSGDEAPADDADAPGAPTHGDAPASVEQEALSLADI